MEIGTGVKSVDEHEMGTGTETIAVAKTGTGTRTGLGRAEERLRSGRNCARVADAMWETGETWVEREKKVDKKVLVQ